MYSKVFNEPNFEPRAQRERDEGEIERRKRKRSQGDKSLFVGPRRGKIFEKLPPFSLMAKVLSRNLHRADIPEDVDLPADVCAAGSGGVFGGKY